MIIKIDNNLSIFFGDAVSCPVGPKTPEFNQFCDDLRRKNMLTHIAIGNQVHGTDGIFIQDLTNLAPVNNQQVQADFLITNQQNTGIGILTADCLPIVFYLPKQNIIAVTHAGWRGSVARIAEKTINTMLKYKAFKPEELMIYFGPAARTCCYEVQQNFLPNIQQFGYRDRLIVKSNNKLFFDVALLNALQLIDLGISPKQINREYNLCTICNTTYHSYRRSAPTERQITMAWTRK